MSVIFKTLEKVRRSSLSQEKKGNGSKRSRNIYSFRRIVISPFGVLCLAVLLILLALSTHGGTFFGDYFSRSNKRHVTGKGKPVIRAAIDVKPHNQGLREKNRSLEVFAKAREMTHEEDLPRPPADIPVESVEPGKLYPSTSSLNEIPLLASNPKYSPPKSQTRFEKPSGEVEGTMGPSLVPKKQILSGDEPGEGPLNPSAGNSPKDGYKLPAEHLSDNVGMSYVPRLGGDKMTMDNGPKTTGQRAITFEPSERLSAASDAARDGDTRDLARLQGEALPDPSVRLNRDGHAVSGDILEKPSTSKEGKGPSVDGIYKVNLEKAARVGRVVSKIERSMIEGDMDHAKVLIDQLTELKGEESPYLLKLRAVWHMRQRDYASAASLLTRVLEKQEDDLEAGINMAIIELQTHRREEARKRLARLRELYQANTIIPELIRETGG